MEDRYVTDDLEQREILVISLSLKLMIMLIIEGFPPCNETVMALRLCARLQAILPDNKAELMAKGEDAFVKMAKEELAFIMKDV